MRGCNCHSESLYSIPTRQDTDTILSSLEPIPRGESRISDAFRVDGQSIIRIGAESDGDIEIRVEEAADCENPIFRETARFSSILDPDGEPFIAVRYAPAGEILRIIEVSPALGTLQTVYQIKVTAQPIGCCEGGAWAGLDSPEGPGKTIVTKADLVIGVAVETDIIVAADIPSGTRRITIKNVGANPIRIKADGEGGGAGRGLEMTTGQTMSIGTRGGAIAALDGFSTLGTTLSFFFERD